VRIFFDEGDNADWTKQTWDLPAQTWEEVRQVTGMSKTAFKKTPAYRLARRHGTLPPALRE
jgi:hypothetical protein